MEGHFWLKPRKQLLVIFLALYLLSSIPNVGILFDQTLCAVSPCVGSKLQNPFILPYWWLLPEKRCSYCSLAETMFAVFYQNALPLIAILNMVVGITYLFVLSMIIDFCLDWLKKRGVDGFKRGNVSPS